MNPQERRRGIVSCLLSSQRPLSGGELAKRFGVSRQIIVSDIGALRASGTKICSRHRGYTLERDTFSHITKRIRCRHGQDRVREEFYAVVDHGGTVLDVTVNHPMYGEISVPLSIATRQDADEFVKTVATSDFSPLSNLTGGVHMHTLLLDSQNTYDRICRALTGLGMLIDVEGNES